MQQKQVSLCVSIQINEIDSDKHLFGVLKQKKRARVKFFQSNNNQNSDNNTNEVSMTHKIISRNLPFLL